MFSRLGQIVQRLRGGAVELSLRSYQRLLPKIALHDAELQGASDDRLQSVARRLKKQLSDDIAPDNLLPEAFALVREVAARAVSMRPYDEQMMAGAVLHQGKVVQMQTGEGKTLAALAPAVLNGIDGRGVHILTLNDYLAGRDADYPQGDVFDRLSKSVKRLIFGGR